MVNLDCTQRLILEEIYKEIKNKNRKSEEKPTKNSFVYGVDCEGLLFIEKDGKRIK